MPVLLYVAWIVLGSICGQKYPPNQANAVSKDMFGAGGTTSLDRDNLCLDAMTRNRAISNK